jgi:uncharacterized protein YuzE
MNPKMRFTFSQKIVAENPSLVVVRLREGVEATVQKQGETILDLNRAGNWIRGIEIVGGFVPFSVAKAVSPLNPFRPGFPKAPEPGTVTYDSEADAAFIYLEYDPTFIGLTLQAQAELKAVSHSVNPTATYGLDGQGGLVWVKIPIADISGSVEQFLQLLRK